VLTERVLERNPELIDTAVKLQQDGRIRANTWLYDLDAVAHNARIQADEAKRLGLTTFLMTKQFSRNPVVASVALSQGLYKTVAVDALCARVLNRYGVPVGHVGHLNQIPRDEVDAIIAMEPDLATVYSVEAARRISVAAGKIGRLQPLLMRIFKPGDVFFEGQEGGFPESEAIDAARQIMALPNVKIVGVTSFPCTFYNFSDSSVPLRFNPNMQTILDAAQRLRDELGLEISVINAPGNTSTRWFPRLKEAGATHIEPGHGLIGTTAAQIAESGHPEKPVYVYVSEISHHVNGYAYAYGGGLWSLFGGFLDPSWKIEGFVGKTGEAARANRTGYEHMNQNIDYHLPIPEGDRCEIGDTAVYPLYSQTQMTRSYTVAVSGISTGNLEVWGFFDHATTLLDANHDPVPPLEAKAMIADAVSRYK
jgi:predicted amino acid racemase